MWSQIKMLNPSSHLHIQGVFKKEHINYNSESASEGPLSPRRPLTTFYNGNQQQSHCRRGFCSNLSLSLSDKHRFNRCIGNCTPNNLHQKEVETWTAWNCWPNMNPEQQLFKPPYRKAESCFELFIFKPWGLLERGKKGEDILLIAKINQSQILDRIFQVNKYSVAEVL